MRTTTLWALALTFLSSSAWGAEDNAEEGNVEETTYPFWPPWGSPFPGYKNAVYYTNWGAANYSVNELPFEEITHILYAFADISPNGTVVSSDPATDVERRHWSEAEEAASNKNDAHGAVRQLFLRKQRHRHLKVLLSIGGGNFSPKFAAVAASAARREAFARSAVRLATDWGFDGIDVDWEHPATDRERADFVALLAACRRAFDAYQRRHRLPYRFQITVASPASELNLRYLDLAGMDEFVDAWHLMAYDYAGNWSATTNHQANLYAGRSNNNQTTGLNTHGAVQHYAAAGIAGRKLVLGLPLYGRAFGGTAGLGQRFAGVGSGGPEPGIWYYRDLPRPGAAERWDADAQAAYSYDNATRELVSYDTPRSAAAKARYMVDRGLGGAFFWEARGDKKGPEGLVGTVARHLGWRLDRSPNNLRYPTSRYENIRRGLPWYWWATAET